MAIGLILEDPVFKENYKLEDCYLAICDANRDAAGFLIRYRGATKAEQTRKIRLRSNNSFVFESVSISSALREIPRIYNGSRDAVVVANDNFDTIDYAKFFFDCGTPGNRRLRKIKSNYAECIPVVNRILEPARNVVSCYPVFFAKIENSKKKNDNAAHVLCTNEARNLKKSRIKKDLKHLCKNGYYDNIQI
ncbi:MAG: hypothetical protein V1818_01620 [Candidatus Aenigmatarchaeota archaeon]